MNKIEEPQSDKASLSEELEKSASIEENRLNFYRGWKTESLKKILTEQEKRLAGMSQEQRDENPGAQNEINGIKVVLKERSEAESLVKDPEQNEEVIDLVDVVEDEEGLDAEAKEDLKEELDNIDNLNNKDKKKLFEGLADLGYRTTEWKSKALGGLCNKVSKWTKKNKFLGSYFQNYAGIYEKLGTNAKKKRETRGKSGIARGAGIGQGLGNFFRYGRVVYDIADRGSLRGLNPFRHVTAAAMIVGRSAEAAKETRLDYEGAKEKTRVKDEKQAMEEAWGIYEKAQGESKDKNITAVELEKAYKDNLPEDVQARFNRMNLPVTKWYQLYFNKSKDVKVYADRLTKKIEKIDNNDNLNSEEKKLKRQELLQRNEQLLHDLDRMVGDQGTVDNVAYWSRFAEKTGKGVATALIIDSVARVAKASVNLHQLFDRFEEDKEGADQVPKVAGKIPMREEGVIAAVRKMDAVIGEDTDRFKSEANLKEAIKGVEKSAEPEVAAEIKAGGPGQAEIARAKQLLNDIGASKENIEEAVEKLSADGSLTEDITALRIKNFLDQSEQAFNEAGVPEETWKQVVSKVKIDKVSEVQIEDLVKKGIKITEDNFKEAHQLLQEAGADIKFTDGKMNMVYEIGRGKDADFKYMDQAMRRIVLDKMDLSGSKSFAAIEAAKAENALANLRELTNGHNVAGMKADDFKDIIGFNKKTGQLEIYDYPALEKKLEVLTGNANEVVNEQSDALAHTQKTSQAKWQEMLDQKTGNQNEITAEDFSKDKSVIKADYRIKAAENPFFDKEPKQYSGMNYWEEKLDNNRQMYYVDKDNDGKVDYIIEADQKTNDHLYEGKVENGTQKDINSFKQEADQFIKTRDTDLSKSPVPKQTMREAGLNPYDQELSNKPELKFLIDNSNNPESLHKAVDAIQTVKNNQCNISYEDAFKYYEQIQGVKGKAGRIEGVVDILNNKNHKGALMNIFGSQYHDNVYEIGKGVYRIKDAANGFDIVAKVKGENLKFGVDGPFGKWNWGADGTSWRFRADADLTNDNIEKAKGAIKEMARAITRKH